MPNDGSATDTQHSMLNVKSAMAWTNVRKGHQYIECDQAMEAAAAAKPNTEPLARKAKERRKQKRNEWEKEAQDLSNAEYVKKLGITAKKQ